MKSILLVMSFVLSFNTFSQLELIESTNEKIKIGSVEIMGSVWMSCFKYNKEVNGENTIQYLFTYRNLKYSAITDYKSFWINGDKDFNELYELISKTIGKEEKNLEIKLESGNELTLKFKKKYVEFRVWNGTYWSFSPSFKQKQIDKLFGKYVK